MTTEIESGPPARQPYTPPTGAAAALLDLAAVEQHLADQLEAGLEHGDFDGIPGLRENRASFYNYHQARADRFRHSGRALQAAQAPAEAEAPAAAAAPEPTEEPLDEALVQHRINAIRLSQLLAKVPGFDSGSELAKRGYTSWAELIPAAMTRWLEVTEQKLADLEEAAIESQLPMDAFGNSIEEPAPDPLAEALGTSDDELVDLFS